MFAEILNDPMTGFALFFICSVLALGSLVGSLKHGGSATGIIMAILFAGVAAYFAPGAFDIIANGLK